jgi:hypothetical protein
MGNIPDDTEWFVAELVMEITVQGSSRNVVHRNLTLVHAAEAEAAYQRALSWGYKAEVSYKNPKGQLVEIKFRGVSRLDVVIDPLEDGTELVFEEFVGVPPEEIERWIRPKEQLEAFKKPSLSRTFDPDYRSKAILDKVDRLLTE